MPTCPHCNEEVDYLKLWITQEALSTSTLNECGEAIENTDLDYEETRRDYECPSCDEVICNTEEEAVAFLKGGETE